ncbi:hypothetical protein [Gemmatimonas sp.]
MSRHAFTLLAPALLLVAPATLMAQASADAVIPPVAVAGAVLAPLTANASPVPNLAGPAANTAPASGPVVEGRTVALRSLPAPTPAPRAPRGNSSDNRALMIVGGVGLLVGAVIGGDAGTLVMLGSAGVGLWGLYRYLN